MSEGDHVGQPSTSKNGGMTRLQRNVAEKQRRDKINGLVGELANIVPMVSKSSKRPDRISILRLSAAHLRLCKSPLNSKYKLLKSMKWCPSFLKNCQIRNILDSVDGFLLVTTPTGKVLFTSQNVERYLGHQDIDLIGHSLYSFVHPDDLDDVKNELEKLLVATIRYGGSGAVPRCSFRCRLREKGQPRSEAMSHQVVHIVGDITLTSEDSDNGKFMTAVNQMFKAFVRVVDVDPYGELSLEEAIADEYITKHSLDGTIIFADPRLSPITGHMPHEVVGFSAYAYIHPDDISITLFAQRLMLSSDKGTGMIVYRLRTKEEKYVYLKSVGCLQPVKPLSPAQIDHFVCVNQQLSEAEGIAQMNYFVERFVPHIKADTLKTHFESIKECQPPASQLTIVNKTTSSLTDSNASNAKSSHSRDVFDFDADEQGEKLGIGELRQLQATQQNKTPFSDLSTNTNLPLEQKNFDLCSGNSVHGSRDANRFTESRDDVLSLLEHNSFVKMEVLDKDSSSNDACGSPFSDSNIPPTSECSKLPVMDSDDSLNVTLKNPSWYGDSSSANASNDSVDCNEGLQFIYNDSQDKEKSSLSFAIEMVSSELPGVEVLSMASSEKWDEYLLETNYNDSVSKDGNFSNGSSDMW